MWSFDLNWLAIFVAAVAGFALGALWYSPLLFAKPWMAGHGYTPADVERMQKAAGRAYAISFLSMVVMGVFLAILCRRLPIDGWQQGAELGFFVWLGFVATTGLTNWAFSSRKISTWVIDAGYQLVYLAIMGAIIAAWA